MFYFAKTYPLNKGFFCRSLKVPQTNVSTFGPYSHRSGVNGIPLQTSDPAVKWADSTMEMI